MQGVYGGLICILTYGLGIEAEVEDVALITQNDLFILTQGGDEILT